MFTEVEECHPHPVGSEMEVDFQENQDAVTGGEGGVFG